MGSKKKIVQHRQSTEALIKVLRQSNQSLETHIDKIRADVEQFIVFLDEFMTNNKRKQ